MAMIVLSEFCCKIMCGTGNWLEVELDGFHPGAIVSVTLPDGRTLKREIHAGSSYLSSEDPRCHFGLGTAEKVTDFARPVAGWVVDAAGKSGGESAVDCLSIKRLEIRDWRLFNLMVSSR